MNKTIEGVNNQEKIDKSFELEIHNLEGALIDNDNRLLSLTVTNLILLLGDFENPISLGNANAKIMEVFQENISQINCNQYKENMQTVIINKLVKIATFNNEDVQDVLGNIKKQSAALL